MSEVKQETRRSWLWLLLLFSAAVMVDGAFYGQMVAFTPIHLAKLGLTPDEVVRYTGLLSSLTWLVGIPFLPLWGALADRYSRQPVIARSFLAFLIAAVLMLIARDVWLFALGRAIMSFALGNTGLMMTTLAERVPNNRLGLAFAIMNSAAPLGYFVAPLIGGPLVDAFGLPALLIVNMVALGLVFLGISFGYKDTYRGTATGPLWKMAFGSLTIIARSPGVRSVLFAMFALFLGWQGVLPYVPLAVAEISSGIDPATAVGIVVGLGGLSAMIIGPLAGALADRYGRVRVLFIGAVISVILLPLPMLARSVPTLTVAWGAANAVLSAIFALSFTVLSETTPEDTRGRVMSFAFLPQNTGAVVGPAITSVVAGISIWYVFPVASALTLLSLGTLWYAARQVGSSAQAAPIRLKEQPEAPMP